MAQWIEHAGKKILFLDCRGFGPEPYLKEMDALEREYENTGHAGEKNQMLVLIDITDSAYTNEAIRERMEAITKKSAAYGFALVGVFGIKKIIAAAIRPDVHFARSVDEAKDWLVNRRRPG